MIIIFIFELSGCWTRVRDGISRCSRGEVGVQFGNLRSEYLLCTDDVVLLASSGRDLLPICNRGWESAPPSLRPENGGMLPAGCYPKLSWCLVHGWWENGACDGQTLVQTLSRSVGSIYAPTLTCAHELVTKRNRITGRMFVHVSVPTCIDTKSSILSKVIDIKGQCWFNLNSI